MEWEYESVHPHETTIWQCLAKKRMPRIRIVDVYHMESSVYTH